MTDEEFDNTTFRKGDKIEVRRYFKTEVENEHNRQMDKQLQTTTNSKVYSL